MVAEAEVQDSKYLLFSWFPGLEGQFRTDITDIGEVRKVIDSLDPELGLVKAIIWLSDGDDLAAVLLVNRAMDIYESAKNWSADCINEWFQVRTGKYGNNGHYFRVFPNCDKSAERFIQNNFTLTGNYVTKSQISMTFGMLSFISKDNNSSLRNMLEGHLSKVPADDGTIDLFLIDSDLIDGNTAQEELLTIVDEESIEFGKLQFKIVDIPQEEVDG